MVKAEVGKVGYSLFPIPPVLHVGPLSCSAMCVDIRWNAGRFS